MRSKGIFRKREVREQEFEIRKGRTARKEIERKWSCKTQRERSFKKERFREI
ncbi:MAG: hypothetical protein LBU29_01810 [Endomicrobium sp.]|jgi:hypothetical protein|nr:hypothetical protein [Endomicrobium sp.]